MKFRKKPLVVEAFQMTAERHVNNVDWPEWLHAAWQISAPNCNALYRQREGDDSLQLQTLEGQVKITVNDWLIRGVHGELYPCKPDVFEATYEAVP